MRNANMKTILVVDDNQQNLYMLEILLPGYGFEVETAQNGEEALKKARKKPPVLIIADILMPVMDGFSLCREWKKDARLKSIPFVFYTATYTDPKDEDFALSLGAARFIVKPVEPENFIAILREVLTEYQEDKFAVPAEPEKDETIILKQYNARLIKKLEDKLFQLEEEAKQRLHTQVSLVESEEKFRNLVRQAVDGIALADEDGFLIEWNESMSEITGYKAENILGQTIWEVQFQMMPEEARTPEALDALKSSLKEALKTGDLSRAGELMERDYQHPDGSLRILQGSIFPLKTDKGFMLGSFTRDVSASRLVEEKHKKILQSARDGYFLVDLRGKIEEVNTAACEMSGYSEEELLQMTIMDIDGEMSSRAIIQKLSELIQSKGGYLTSKMRRKDGSLFEIELSIKVAAINGGRMVAFARDITERTKAEENQRLQIAALQAAAHGIVITDVTGDIFWVNQGFTDITGYSARDAIGQKPSILKSGKHEAKFYKQLWDTILAGKVWHSEVINKRKDGSLYTEEETITPLVNQKDEITHFIAIKQDISNRKQAELDLLRSETRYRGIFEGVYDAIFVESPDGKILDVNERACQIFGYSREEFLAKKVTDLMPPDQEPLMPDHTGTGSLPDHPVETVNIRANGELFPVEISGRLYSVGDEQVLLVVLRDITERKKSEKALKNSLGELAHNQQLLVALSKAAQAVQQAKTPELVLQTISEQILALGFHNTIFFLSADKSYLENAHMSYESKLIKKAEKITGLSAKGYRHLIQEGSIYHDALKTGKTVFDDSAAAVFTDAFPITLGPITKQLVRLLDFEQAIYVPLVIDNQPIGLLTVVGSDLKESDVSAMAAFGNQAAIALKNAQLYRDANQRLKRVEALHAIDLAIGSVMDLPTLLSMVLNHVMSQLECDAADVLLQSKSTHTLSFGVGKGFRFEKTSKNAALPLGTGFTGQVVMERKTLRVSNPEEFQQDPYLAAVCARENFVSYIGVPLITKGEVKGILEIFHRQPFSPENEWLDFLETLAAQIAIAIDNAQLYIDLEQRNLELSLAYDDTVQGWSLAMDLRDEETEDHTKRVTEMTLELARLMNIPKKQLIHIRRGALLHDIGKMGVPDSILLKPGKLTDEEWQIMYKHPVFAYEMLVSIEYLKPAIEIPYSHHEKWDGTGYPQGLKGDVIPLPARIFAVVDVWDALTNDRPYRKAWSKKDAMDYIQKQAGSHFDPDVVDAFLGLIATN